MNRHASLRSSLGIAAGLILLLLGPAAEPARVEVGLDIGPAVKAEMTRRPRRDEAYGKLPLAFEINRGQAASVVEFMSRGPGYTLFLTPTEAVLTMTKGASRPRRESHRLPKPVVARPDGAIPTVVKMKLVGANPKPKVIGREKLPGTVNYFIGNDPKKWRTNVPTYARVEYQNVYPGINMVYYGNQRQLEYDFVVAPGADPRRIRLAFEGVDKLDLDARGNLMLRTAHGEMLQRAPVIYQDVAGAKREISGRYVVKGKNRVIFQVAAYDVNRPLIIDPVLVYSTYLGGSAGEAALGIALDGSGNVYVAGYTRSVDFPVASPFQANLRGSLDVFVSKINASGSLVYSTYLGGSKDDPTDDLGWAVAVDAAGNAYVTGATNSDDFPTTAGAFQPALSASCCAYPDAFVVKLNPTGSALVYSTYLGGSSSELGRGIAVDSGGNAYVTGSTNSPDFPTASAIQPTSAGLSDAFVAKLNAAGTALVYSTYLGGGDFETGRGIAVDGSGHAYVTGITSSPDFPTANPFQAALAGFGNVFVTKLNPAGTAFVYSTYLGGSAFDEVSAIALDSAGSAYVAGTTRSTDFPLVNPLQAAIVGGITDGFVVKFAASGSTLAYATYAGIGADECAIRAVAVDGAGNAYVTGETTSPSIPLVNPIQATLLGPSDAVVMKLNATGSARLFSTYLGGANGFSNGVGIAVDAAGRMYVAGHAGATDFPLVNPLQSGNRGGGADVFVAKIAEIANNTPAGSNVVVQPVDLGATLTFDSVTTTGVTSLIRRNDGPPPPAGFSLGTPPTYYDIKTTATFTSHVQVCIAYDPAQFSDPAALQLFHFESSAWVDVTTSNDTGAGIICGQTSSLSPFLAAERTSLAVTIDIKPGSYPNTINLGSNGVVPVAIMSTATFDARTVDPITVTLANAAVKLKGNGKPQASFQDVNGDGRPDLVVHVETSALELTSTDTVAVLKARTFSGQPVKGSDSVRIVPQ